MATRKQVAPRFAICVENAEYPASLELHKVYRVVPDAEAEKDGDLRIIRCGWIAAAAPGAAAKKDG